jgi:lycopene beta-cyclase
VAERLDLILVGGGLANGLIAWRLAQVRPDVRFVILEGSERLGGNQTWSFHDDDLKADEHRWMADLVAHRWAGLRGGFSGFRAAARQRIPQRHFGALPPKLMEIAGDRIRLGRPSGASGPSYVRPASGEVMNAGAVIDGRGPGAARTWP